MSDNLTPFIILENKHSTTHKKVRTRKCGEDNLKALETLLQGQNWDRMIDAEKQEDKYTIFEECFQEHFNTACPLVERSYSSYLDKTNDWMTDGILVSRNRKENLHHNYIRLRTPASERKFRDYNRVYNRVCTQAKAWQRSEYFEANKGKMKELWAETNRMLNRGRGKTNFPEKFIKDNKIYTKPKEIANLFNDFFVNVGKNLAEKFSTSDDYKKYLPPREGTFEFKEVSNTDIHRIIQNMESKRSTGFDEVSNKVIKAVRTAIANPITHLINNSLQTGTIPKKLKIAKVIPLYKSGEKADVSNYRPISLLFVFSKI